MSKEREPEESSPLRHFTLISVNFKEAALDSPSFRATINHLDLQVDNVEKWLIALNSTVKKFPKFIRELENVNNSFLEHLVPTFIQDGLIDQEYTVQALRTTADGFSGLFASSLASMAISSYVTDNLLMSVSKTITAYKEFRASFQIYQEKYDKYLNIYASTPKTKDPVSVMEDAHQLFQVKKKYINLCLQLVSQFTDLGNCLDKALVKVCVDAWISKSKRNLALFENPDKEFYILFKQIQRIKSWSEVYFPAVDKLQLEMMAARDQVEQSAIDQATPSKVASDYNISLINGKVLAETDETSIEKHGYLFMKTYVEKSSKPIWVRRWAFVKDGVFGILNLSPSQTFVQETDKIGVLLCNLRYAPQEERKFCFELRTIDTTVIFQAETITVLKSWLKVFDNERKRALSSSESDSALLAVASGRFPPIVTEFASTLNTYVDRELTNSKIIDSTGQVITSSRLSNQIQQNERFFQRHLYYQIPQIRPPFVTDTTKSSILSYTMAASNSLPTALTANIWGSANWGLYYLYELSDTAVESSLDEALNLEGEDGLNYPDYYPSALLSLDIQMRSLFETAIAPNELCLLSYRCFLSPNPSQELSSRCFITNKHVYLYMQSSGFISLSKLPISTIVAADFELKKKFDILKIFTMRGLVRMKIFLDDAELIKLKVDYLVENIASEKPKHLHEVVNTLVKMENQHEINKLNKARYNYASKLIGKPMAQLEKNLDEGEYSNIQTSFAASLKKTAFYKTNFKDESHLFSENVYEAPPKAIFHTFLGDNSDILLLQNTLYDFVSVARAPWYVEDGLLKKKYNCGVMINSKHSGEIQVAYAIEESVDNEYYNFTFERKSFKVCSSAAHSIKFRYVIVKLSEEKSKVFTYYDIKFESILPFHMFLGSFCSLLATRECYRIRSLLRKAIIGLGAHGKINKSINIYGRLSKVDTPYQVEDTKTLNLGVLVFLRVSFKRAGIHVVKLIVGFFHFLLNLVIAIFKGIRLNWILLVIIMLLSWSNLLLGYRTTTSYWVARSTTNIAKEYLTEEPFMLQRAVYLKDTQELFGGPKNFSHTNSQCFQSFKKTSFVLNFEQSIQWTQAYGDETTRALAIQLKSSFKDIGLKRHELLVKLKMLDTMEEELGKAEWTNWLASEVGRCEYIMTNVVSQLAEVGEKGPGIDSVYEYCQSCVDDLKLMNNPE